jgi:hypothetical protein
MQGRLQVKAGPDWIEPCNLFLCSGMAPGNRKSATFSHMVRPVLDAEAELADAARPAIIEAITEAEIARRAAEQALAVASKNPSDPDAVNNAKTAALDAEAATIPVEPKLIADDITPEAAKSLLAEQSGRLAILSAEGGIFATIAGRYSGVPDLDVFLKGHAGDLLRVVRKSAPPEYIPAPALTLGLAVPPDVLLAQGSPLVYHRGPGYGRLLREVTVGLKALLRTEADVLLFTSSGTGGLESAVANLVRPGDRID